MTTIVAHFKNGGVPLTSPTTAPTIRIRRLSDDTLVVTDANMTEVGDGAYKYDFTEDKTLEYSFRCDADPLAAGQVTAFERYKEGALNIPTPNQVWDALQANHLVANSLGIKVRDIFDVVQLNFTELSATIPNDFITVIGHTSAIRSGLILTGPVNVASGSTVTEIRSGLGEPDGFYDGMTLVFVDASNSAAVARKINSYLNTNGALTIDALPVTPTTSDSFLIVPPMMTDEQAEFVRKILVGPHRS